MTDEVLVVARTDRDVVEITGPEALSFVHSQVSQDIEKLPIGQSRWSFVLQPQGKVDGLFRATRMGEESLLLDTEAGQGQVLEASISRFKLRTKAEFTTSTVAMLMFRGSGAVEAAEGLDALAVVEAPWAGGNAVDVIGSRSDLEPNVSAEEFDQLRMCHGMPAIGVDIDNSAIPNETGLLDLAVSFSKGCYRGQELVERINSRGGNRRLLHRLQSADGSDLVSGSGLEVLASESGTTTVGAVTSASGAFGFGYIRGDAEQDATLVSNECSVQASVLF